MEIINSTKEDIPLMLEFYEMAREHQKARSNRHWQSFPLDLLEKEIEEKRQWKIAEGGETVCIFMTAYKDPYIWGEKDKDPAVYLHRIVTHKDHRGKNYVSRIIDWSKEHAKAKGKKFLRMDTWGDNPKLIDYYTQCGFAFLGIIVPENTENLPPHYSCISLSLFEMPVEETIA